MLVRPVQVCQALRDVRREAGLYQGVHPTGLGDRYDLKRLAQGNTQRPGNLALRVLRPHDIHSLAGLCIRQQLLDRDLRDVAGGHHRQGRVRT